MSVRLAPVFNNEQFINGLPASGGLLFSYAAGSSTKLTTYTDSTGVTPQANPIVLNARGEPASPIWLTSGLSYKFVFSPSTDTDPPTSPIRTIDNITGINDSSTTIDQWVVSGLTPTYVSATQFTLVGDQTSAFEVNRRVKFSVTAGTVYGYISVSAYTTLTTVTVVLDSGALDAGLSAVYLGLLTATNVSYPKTIAKSGANSDITSLTGLTSPITGVGDNSKIQPITASVSANALTITLNPTSLDFRSATLGSGTVNTRTIAAAISVVVSSGSTLGTVSTIQNRLAVLAIDNAGTVELAVVNISGGNDLTETGLISTTAEGGAGAADSANVIYSTTARTNVPYRVVGYVESTQATAGTWATAPSTIQGYGGQALAAMSSFGYGQTLQDVTASRALSTTYYNTTGKTITVYIKFGNSSSADVSGLLNGVIALQMTFGAYSIYPCITLIVPPNMAYSITNSAGTLSFWKELR